MKRWILLAFLLQFIILSLNSTGTALAQTDTPPPSPLPMIGSEANLQALLAKFQQSDQPSPYNNRPDMTMAGSAPSAATKDARGEGLRGADHSSTNVQVDGVDEGDRVKTDGRYIYQVSGNRIRIIQAAPAQDMALLSTLTVEDPSFTPVEIYLDGDRLAIIGNSYENQPNPGPMVDDSVAKNKMWVPPYRVHSSVKTLVYDVADRAKPQKIRETEVEGSYLSSRKIGSKLYLLANKEAYFSYQPAGKLTPPVYRDSAIQKDPVSLDWAKIPYFPDFVTPNFLLLSSLDLNANQPLKVDAYLGAGQTIYASTENLFVAVAGLEKTTVYKFGLQEGQPVYRAKGEVPGTVLNQFSMDEREGWFRIATTAGNPWNGGQAPSQNNLYVLDSAMNRAGAIENIAPGERIYSVRFLGERAYMVTFRTVDPLFAIDLKDPKAPRILGALKIPGYSDYLHPYDENHLIGFGKDTMELPQKNGDGTSQTQGYYLGMKAALFDVTDPANPKEEYSVKIGDRGTDSELLHNHKALLFSREKNLLAFPVNLHIIPDGQVLDPATGFPRYGQFAYQGAYIYSLDPQQGFVQRGRISHLSNEDLAKAGYQGFDTTKQVERILTIGDTLYTLSAAAVKANDLTTLQEIKALPLPMN